MPTPPAAAGPVRSAAVINAEIRARTAGRTYFSAAELAELRELQAEWQKAVDRETALAA